MRKKGQLKQATVLTKECGEALPLLMQCLFSLDKAAFSSSCLQSDSQDTTTKQGDKEMLLAFATDFYQWDPPPILKESHCHIVCPSIEATPVYIYKRGCLIWNLYALQPVASPTVTPLHSLQGPSDLEIQFATSTYAAPTHLWTFLHGGLIWQLLVTGDSISFISPR